MAGTAILVADDVERARFVEGVADMSHHAGNGGEVDARALHFEAMDHIAAGNVERDVSAHREGQRRGGARRPTPGAADFIDLIAVRPGLLHAGTLVVGRFGRCVGVGVELRGLGHQAVVVHHEPHRHDEQYGDQGQGDEDPDALVPQRDMMEPIFKGVGS